MTAANKPNTHRPFFSSGPVAKVPGWNASDVEVFYLQGRSHRSLDAQDQLEDVVCRLRALLDIPEAYKVVLLPGSATGAMQTAFWSLLGLRGIDLWVTDEFSRRWSQDVTDSLKLCDVRVFESSFGHAPDLTQADGARDQIFCWNGTTSGIKMPDGDWISESRCGLTFCDATSAVFSMSLPWNKLDVTGFSWQKGFGGEAGVGVLVLSPRALEQLHDFTPPWPIPRTMRLKKDGALNYDLLDNAVPLNTVSMLSVADALYSLSWVQQKGGLQAMQRRVQENKAVMDQWVAAQEWIEYAVQDAAWRSPVSVTLSLKNSVFQSLPVSGQWAALKRIATQMSHQKMAHDILGHSAGKPVLRFWCGPTVNFLDLKQALDDLATVVAGHIHAGFKADQEEVVDFKSSWTYKETMAHVIHKQDEKKDVVRVV